MNLSFLKNITLKPNTEVKSVGGGRSSTPKNPTESDLRIFKNGAVYPSQKLVDALNLNYVNKDVEDKGNGFDVFSSKNFPNTSDLEQAVLFIALVPKNAGKVDLFASTKYNEDLTPVANVMTQGTTTFGKTLLETIKEVYGVEIPEDKDFMDLTIVKDQPFTTNNGIYYIPKEIKKGDTKGEMDVVVRKDTELYVLVPTSIANGEEPATETNVIQDEDTAGLGIEEQDQDSSEVSSEAGLTLAEIEAEADGTVSPAAELPKGILEEDTQQETDSSEDSFKLDTEESIEENFQIEETEEDDNDLLSN